ncbi:MAG TPA: hypothetical protein VHO70_19195 [Chitinispirillaceae bacterium]|nr:hypothetical protein [Chitinispirillaceae bacterium]
MVRLHRNGINANHIVKWDGSNWCVLGKGIDGEVTRLNFDCKGNLYVSGNFNIAGEKPARRIALWDGNQWHPLR